MFRKVQVPVLGIVENMATHVCSHCGHEDAIFSAGGGERLGEELGVPLLGSLPLERQIREQTDGGCPTVVATPESLTALRYQALAKKVSQALEEQSRQRPPAFPKIVVE